MTKLKLSMNSPLKKKKTYKFIHKTIEDFIIFINRPSFLYHIFQQNQLYSITIIALAWLAHIFVVPSLLLIPQHLLISNMYILYYPYVMCSLYSVVYYMLAIQDAPPHSSNSIQYPHITHIHILVHIKYVYIHSFSSQSLFICIVHLLCTNSDNT